MAFDTTVGDALNLLQRTCYPLTDAQLNVELARWRELKADILATGPRVDNFGLGITRLDFSFCAAAEAVILQIQLDRLNGINGPVTRTVARIGEQESANNLTGA